MNNNAQPQGLSTSRIPIDAPLVCPPHHAQDSLQDSREATPLRGNLAAAAAVLKAKREHWSTLSLRQQWADEAFMRAHLRAAGITVASDAEPATVARLRLLLTRAGIRAAEARAAIGMPLDAYLVANPSLPLWVALALVLEAAGKFARAAAAKAHEASNA